MKLYRITLKGMTYSVVGTAYGIPYVIAENPDQAYQIVRSYLDKKDLGFTSDRCLKSIELLAESGDNPECGIQLLTA